jgi:hypothetical protein
LEERSKLIARQGHAFATADELRVVYESESDELVDVPRDGKTLGEIVTRGNIVMKEVAFIHYTPVTLMIDLLISILTILKQQRRRLEGECSDLEIWQS